MTMEITDLQLKELYDAAHGRPSHYVFINDEPEEFIKLLVKEKYIKPVANNNKESMYTITYKTIQKFRAVTKLEQSQMDNFSLELQKQREQEALERLEGKPQITEEENE